MKITICGSMAFHKEMKEIGEKLRTMGHIVEVPLLLINREASKEGDMSIRELIASRGGVDAIPADDPIWDEKEAAIDDHFSKVAWADSILVAYFPKHGVDGYVGGNSLMEVALAHYLKKKIYLLFPISSSLSYKEEILATRPIIIGEDFSKII